MGWLEKAGRSGIRSYESREALNELESVLGSGSVICDTDTLAEVADNSLGLPHRVAAVVFPSTLDHVRKVVLIANKYLLPLYPVSRGRNIGYGERTPVSDGQIVVDLGRMNRIREFDEVHGRAVVEPGVTQGQLYRFLEESGAPYWMDTTGAGLESSLVGNTLEGGFGHSPLGDRRSGICGVEAVLGNGTVLHGGSYPGLGPDLNGLFVQSNLGIVTAIEVSLLPIPERYESFIISMPSDEQLEPLVDRLSELRRRGTLTSLVHIANATRSLMSVVGLPEEFRDRPLTPRAAIDYLSTPIAGAGWWTAIGGLYGSRRQVAAKKVDLRRIFKGLLGRSSSARAGSPPSSD